MEAWDGQFGGTIGRYYFESEAWWPDERRAPRGAPNVLVVVLDDVGWAQLGCYGSDIDTPTFDALAADGTQFTNFHTTALCSPTRACLLSGRNHHAVGMGRITELAAGFPGYHGRIPKSAGFLSEYLRDAGWATWALGKWHLTPEEESHAAATRVRWPLGRGFERFYGFFAGETHQFAPTLVSDNYPVEPPRRWQDGYHLSEDLVDKGVGLVSDLRAIDADKPFFLYLAFGACHSPHQSPLAFQERYRGAFDEGWDAWREATFARQQARGLHPATAELSPRPDWVPPWSSLSADERRVYARYMEAFAAFLSHADHQLGRLLDHLRHTGDLDRTLVVALSDNGASSEGGPFGSLNDGRIWNGLPRTVEEALARLDEIGGPRCHNNYPWGWTVAGNTPFRRWKREVHEGGVCDPLIVRPPGGAAARGLRHQYTHAVDVLPTVLELCGVPLPAEVGGVAQRRVDGASFAAALTDPGAAAHRPVQYFEMFGCRALYQDGWKAVLYHPIQTEDPRLDTAPWELYHVDVDPSEVHDLADAEPDRLARMVERWWVEASRNNVLPVDNRPLSDWTFGRPRALPDRRVYAYRPGGAAVPEPVAANIKNRSHRVSATLEVPEGGADGVIISQGSLLGGWALYVLDGRPRYVHNLAAWEEHRVESADRLAPGRHTLVYRFDKTGEHQGTGTLLVDGAPVAKGDIPRFTPTRFSLHCAGLSAGRDASGLAVTDDYVAPFPFAGTIVGDVVIEVDGEPFEDAEAEARVAIQTQ
jgi:arylsulfatase A-like enzyme